MSHETPRPGTSESVTHDTPQPHIDTVIIPGDFSVDHVEVKKTDDGKASVRIVERDRRGDVISRNTYDREEPYEIDKDTLDSLLETAHAWADGYIKDFSEAQSIQALGRGTRMSLRQFEELPRASQLALVISDVFYMTTGYGSTREARLEPCTSEDFSRQIVDRYAASIEKELDLALKDFHVSLVPSVLSLSDVQPVKFLASIGYGLCEKEGLFGSGEVDISALLDQASRNFIGQLADEIDAIRQSEG